MVDVQIFADRKAMGQAAADVVAAALTSLLDKQDSVRMVFAAAPSQQELLDALVEAPGIDWSRVAAFHMDDYVGLPADAPQRFGNWLRGRLFDRLPFRAVHLIDPDQEPEAAAAAYAALLDEAPIDLVCLGIGVNGHLAFNDPPVADLRDPLAVKVVELDEICRQQQVDDACFAHIDQVPRHAITLTIPRLLDARTLVCVVPGAAKSTAVRRALNDEIGTACPATALRTHPACSLFLDKDSAREL